MKKLFLLFLTLGSISVSAANDEVVCEKWIVVDNTNAQTLAQIKKTEAFKSFNSDTALGFTPFTHWLKVKCTNNSDVDFQGKYQFLYPVLKKLNVYFTEEAKHLGFWDRGNVNHGEDVVLPEISLSIPKKESIEFYVEAQSNGSLQLKSELISDTKKTSSIQNSNFFYGLFFGLLLALMFYNMFLGLSLKDRTYFYYCGYVASFFMYQVTITGYAPIFFGKTGYQITEFRAAYLHLLFMFITIFARRFLLLEKNGKLLSRMMLVIASIYAMAAILTPFLDTQPNLKFSAITSAIVPLILIATAVTVYINGFKPAIFFISAWILFLTAIILTALRNVGLVPKLWIVDHVLEIESW